MKKLFLAVSVAALGLLFAGCSTNRSEFRQASKVSTLDLSKGKPYGKMPFVNATKMGSGFLFIPFAFASEGGARIKLHEQLVKNGIQLGGPENLQIVAESIDGKSHGLWFLIGWVRTRSASAEIYTFPEPATAVAAPTITPPHIAAGNQ